MEARKIASKVFSTLVNSKPIIYRHNLNCSISEHTPALHLDVFQNSEENSSVDYSLKVSSASSNFALTWATFWSNSCLDQMESYIVLYFSFNKSSFSNIIRIKSRESFIVLMKTI